METHSPVNLPKRSAFWQKNLNRGYKSESGLQGFRMAIRKKRGKYGKVLIHRKFLPNFIKGRKTEGRRVLPNSYNPEVRAIFAEMVCMS
jgi:hypothetical protein